MVTVAELNDPVVRVYVRRGVIKEMSVDEQQTVPSPKQVSNRTIYDRCLEWGCKVTRTNGNWVWMISPLQVRFKIRPAQQHESNGYNEIQGLLGSLQVPWSVFIGAEILDIREVVELGKGFLDSPFYSEDDTDDMGPCSVCGNSVYRGAMVKRGKKIAHRGCVKKQQPPAEAEPTPEEETAVPDVIELEFDPHAEEAEPLSPTTSQRQRYINQVFDLLVERGDPMSNRAVGEALGITSQQAGSAMAGLANLGVVTRVKAGVYQAKPQVTRRGGTFGLVLSGDGSIDHPSAPAVHPISQPPPANPYASRSEALGVGPTDEEDETLNELLDLIAVNGFKARHLPLIDAFKRSALALMREVNG